MLLSDHAVTRRRFLRTSLNLAWPFAFGVPLTALGALPARADFGIMFAVVEAAANLANSLSKVSESAGGLNKRLEVIQLELDAILQTQVETLAAVNEVNNNVIKLGELIPNLLTKQEYFNAKLEVGTANDEVKRFGEDVQKMPGRPLGPRDFDRFYHAFQSTRSALSRLDQTTLESVDGDPGVVAMAYAACSITMLAEQCWVLGKIEPLLDESKMASWDAANEFSQLRSGLKSVLATLKTQRLPPLYAGQTSIRDAEAKRLKDNPWATEFFEAIASGPGLKKFDGCLITYIQHKEAVGEHCTVGPIRNEVDHGRCDYEYKYYQTPLLHHRQFTVDAVTLSDPGGNDYLTKSLVYGSETQSQGGETCAAPAPKKSIDESLADFTPDALSFSKAAANVAALNNARAVATQIESAVALMSLPR